MEKVVFITGASSGIGHSCAFKFAENGFNLIITGRRTDRLTQLAGELTQKFGIKVHALSFDVTDSAKVKSAIDGLPFDFKKIDVLINNAGLALGLDPLNEGNPGHWNTMIDTNIKGLLNVSHAIIPGMVERKSGHIINIGSIAGREAYGKGNVYCATKAAVDSLTKGMRICLLPYGIKVTQIAPGAVETEFSLVRFEGDDKRASSVYDGFEPLHPQDVAGVVYYTATLPAHVNINDLLLMPAAQASASIIHRK